MLQIKKILILIFILTLSNITNLLSEELKKSSKIISPDFPKEVQRLINYISSEHFTVETCDVELKKIYNEIFTLSPEYFNWEIITPQIGELISSLTLMKVVLRRRLNTFIENGDIRVEDGRSNLENKCLSSIRSSFRAIRFISDYLGKQSLRAKPEELQNHPSYLEGKTPFFKPNPFIKEIAFGPSQESYGFRSGDVIITRGNAYVSAAIARMSENEAQFSHNTLVYVDENTKKAYTIEAHIEIGVNVRPINKHFSDGNMRAVVYRFKGDPRIAHAGAKRMFELASEASASGENIPYDFHFDQDDPLTLNCTEVVRAAYKMGSEITGMPMFPVPLFNSKISTQIPDFMDALKIDKSYAYLPADVEYDTRFEYLAEWTNFKKLDAVVYKDAALSSMFKWMSADGLDYKLGTTIKGFFAGTLFWFLRKVPPISDKLKLDEKFPTNMPRSTLSMVPSVEKVATKLENHLKAVDQKNMNENVNYLPMTTPELYAELERYRISDRKKWHDCNEFSDFHNLFHARDEYLKRCPHEGK